MDPTQPEEQFQQPTLVIGGLAEAQATEPAVVPSLKPSALPGLMADGPVPKRQADARPRRAQEYGPLNREDDVPERRSGWDVVATEWTGDAGIPDALAGLTWPTLLVLALGTTGVAWLHSPGAVPPPMVAMLALANLAGAVQLWLRQNGLTTAEADGSGPGMGRSPRGPQPRV